MRTRQTEGEQIVEREIIQQRGRKNKEPGLYVWVNGIKKEKERKRDNVLSRREKGDGSPFVGIYIGRSWLPHPVDTKL